MKRILLIGATGEFGSRLAGHLAELADVNLVLTSRDSARAEALAHDLRKASGREAIEGIAFDRSGEVKAKLEALRPWLVIDASGPFQGADFKLARAAIGVGAHWIDLADARDYLLAFSSALGAEAEAHGVAAFAGASSTPALSVAAVRALTMGWRRIDAIDIAIFPAGRSHVGRAVIEAILSYAGKPIVVWREGGPDTVMGWGTLERRRVPILGPRAVAPVETADADLMPRLFSVHSRVAFYAGLESRLERYGLLALARLRALGVLSRPQVLAPVLKKARALTGLFASDTGGMTVEVLGLDGVGKQTFARWLLLAEKGHGPHVPVMAALALTRKLFSGLESMGAHIASDGLTLEEIVAEMAPLALTTSTSRNSADCASLFETACGQSTYCTLPAALRAFHDSIGCAVWKGRADVERGRGLLSRILCMVFGFAAEGRDVPVCVTVDRRGDEERWTRNFAGRQFMSHLKYECGNVVSERFGPFTILLDIGVRGDELVMAVKGWRCFALPLPRVLAPQTNASEYQDAEGRFCFDVEIGAPLVGRIVHYRGWLVPVT